MSTDSPRLSINILALLDYRNIRRIRFNEAVQGNTVCNAQNERRAAFRESILLGFQTKAVFGLLHYIFLETHLYHSDSFTREFQTVFSILFVLLVRII